MTKKTKKKARKDEKCKKVMTVEVPLTENVDKIVEPNIQVEEDVYDEDE